MYPPPVRVPLELGMSMSFMPNWCEYVYCIMLVCTVYIYYHTLIQSFCYYSIGASLQCGVQQLTELPDWTKHASTVQLYNCTALLEYHSKSSTTVQQYNSTTTIQHHYSTTVLYKSSTTVQQYNSTIT